jgi:hypothetical protein
MLKSEIFTPILLALFIPGELKWRPINIEQSRYGDLIDLTNKSVPILPLPMIATFNFSINSLYWPFFFISISFNHPRA